MNGVQEDLTAGPQHIIIGVDIEAVGQKLPRYICVCKNSVNTIRLELARDNANSACASDELNHIDEVVRVGLEVLLLEEGLQQGAELTLLDDAALATDLAPRVVA